MSFRVQHSVSPKLPTALAGRASLDLPGQDLLLWIVEQVHILPTKLDIPTFEDALSRTLQLYPHAAGQLRCNDSGHWSVELTNSAVPVDIEYKFDITSDALLNGDWVVQEDLSPFLSHEPISRCPVDYGDAPLIRFRLVLFENETSIGLSWHHALGDATLIFRFLHSVSRFYQDLPLEYTPPTFEKYHYPLPSASMTAEFLPRIPHFHFTCSLDEIGQLYGDFLKNSQDLKWRFDNDDLTEFRSTLSSRGKNSYLSKQDCLTAYVVAVLNHHARKPVQEVLNICSYRNISAPFITEGVAGNMVYRVPAAVPPDITGVATAIRQALLQFREPEHIHNLMTVSSYGLLQIANSGKGLSSNPPNDTLVTVNSNLGIDWCSVHFGSPDGSRFYTPGSFRHCLRCFKSNPTKGDDGVWRARRSVDISIAVNAEQRTPLLETLSRGFRYMLESEDDRQ